MRRLILTFLVTIIISYISTAQILKGRITNQTGDPVQYATVYIEELRQGTTSNTKGDYEIRLKPAGNIQLSYQSHGLSAGLCRH